MADILQLRCNVQLSGRLPSNEVFYTIIDASDQSYPNKKITLNNNKLFTITTDLLQGKSINVMEKLMETNIDATIEACIILFNDLLLYNSKKIP